MKKYIIIILLLMPIFCNAQSTDQLEFSSISFNPVSAYTGSSGVGGAVGGDLALSYRKNIFLISGYFGEGISFFSSYEDSFSELSLSWGRAHPFNDWLQIEGFVGAGYFYFKNRNINLEGAEKDKTVGFPLFTKLKFMIATNFSIGIQVRVNINSIQTITSFGPYLQLDF
ncbi:hypothetical protein [uncultured Kordia sp.]|uniref:hypothetical protein n=1 Tax=uncultured Kordia sp. TaxID=507699 RepID=UPI00263435C2|nr:hypothetical protein [uncultured Kordia sp.]